MTHEAAIAEEDTLENLIEWYQRWNRENGLNLGSADDHLFDEDLTEAQREWLRDFSQRWEAVEHPPRYR